MSLLVLPAPVEFSSEFSSGEFSSFPTSSSPASSFASSFPTFQQELLSPSSTLAPAPPPSVFLASLASQFHASTYNTAKYGPSGCPIRYIPLSVHLPDHVRELQARQRIAAAADSWWPCESPLEPPPLLLGPCGMPTQDSPALRDQLEAAMQDHLAARSLAPVPLKTSSTHPINISAMIPLELIPLISSHLLLSSGPTVFDIPRRSPSTASPLISTMTIISPQCLPRPRPHPPRRSSPSFAPAPPSARHSRPQ
ncbi:hypothetical protein B0H19DRAFT_32350 [Mycena capillaripes]|nr:hypothetical protein B0H19DRAFT_32350 [Mycena capillaripes]